MMDSTDGNSRRSDAIDPAAVWREDRDQVFAERLAKDIALLSLAGVPEDIILRVIGQYEYVKAWTRCPRWLWPVKKLPKGYSWRDGEKTKLDGREHGVTIRRTIILLPIGEDLYIRDPEHMGPPGVMRGESKGICIRNFRRHLSKDIAVEFDGGLGSVILEFYKKQGLPMGIVPKYLHDAKTNIKGELHEV